MKILAVSAGRKDGNCEVFTKAALMEAEKMGLEVELVRLRDMDIYPCTACSGQFCAAMDDPTKCVHGKDDAAFLIDKFLDCDGFLMAGPVYSTTGSSMTVTFRDRVFGPKIDAVMMSRFGTPKWAEGRVKSRPGALISVGGALSSHWVSMGIPTLYSTCFSASTDVVDFMNVTGIANPGAATLDDAWIERAKQLGRNLAQAVLDNDHSWRGEPTEEDVCPSCHFNAMLFNPKKKDVWCAICGTHGHIVMDGDEMKIEWPEEEQHENHTKPCGLEAHGDEIGEVLMHRYMPHKDEIPAKLKVYQDYSACIVKSPSKEAKKKEILEKMAKEKNA